MARKGKKEVEPPKNKKQPPKKSTGPDFIPAVLEIADLPRSIKEELEKTPELEKLKDNTIEKILRSLKEYMKDHIVRLMEMGEEGEEKKVYETNLRSCVSLIKQVVENRNMTNSLAFASIYSLLPPFLICDTIEPTLRNKMSQVCEKVVQNMKEEGGASLVLSLYLVQSGVESRRGWSTLKHTLPRLDLTSPPCLALVEGLTTWTVDKKYLAVKEGRQVIALFLSTNIALVKPVYNHIMQALLDLPKTTAAHYGDVFYMAWNYAQPAVKKEIEEKCIQDLMVRIMTVKRNGVEFGKAGQWAFAILSRLHNTRRIHAFSTIITELYVPIIWRSLRSGYPIERCNAAQVFLDVFPLEKPSYHKSTNMQYKERQMKEIMDLLDDECHFVRIIAIKGVCKIMQTQLEVWTMSELREVLSKLGDDLVNDGSHWTVRAAVWQGLIQLTHTEATRKLLASILPQMNNYIHDKHPKVRKAFISLLLAARNHEDLPEYYKFIPLAHVAARLELEDTLVGEPLAKLILPDIFNKKMKLDKVIRRIECLINLSPKAAIKFFQFTRKTYDISDIYVIVIGLLSRVMGNAKECLRRRQLDRANENDPEPSDRPRKKSKKFKALQDISNKAEEEEENSSANDSNTSFASEELDEDGDEENEEQRRKRLKREAALNIPLYVLKGILECTSILWVVSENELMKPENEEKRMQLYTMACSTIILLLRTYKGTDMYYAAINFASLIPINKLQPVSTISSACLSELKDWSGDLKVAKCLVYSLCAWNRSQDVLELVMDWLEPAFRTQNLNNTAIQKLKGKRQPKVRFKSGPSKCMMALKLMDVMFSDVAHENRLLNKSYDQLYDFYLYLCRIKLVIERRCEKGSQLNEEDLNDEFLSKCLERALLMTICLHRPDKPPTSSSSVLSELPLHAATLSQQDMVWAKRVLVPRIMEGDINLEEKRSLPAECVNHIFKTANLVVALNLTERNHCFDLIDLATVLLSLANKRWFFEEICNLIITLTEFANAYTENDEWDLLETVIPNLLQEFLNSLVEENINLQDSQLYFSDINTLKNGLTILPLTLKRRYGKRNTRYIEAYNMNMKAAMKTVARVIRNSGDDVEIITKCEDQPFLAEQIIKAKMSKALLISDIIPSLISQISLNIQDSYLVVSSVSLLNTLTHLKLTNYSQLNLIKSVQRAYAEVKKYKKPVNPDCTTSSSFSSNFSSIDVVKVVEPLFQDMSNRLKCTLTVTVRNNQEGEE